MSVLLFFQPLLTASHSLHQQAKGLKKRKRKAKLKLRKLPLPVMQLKDYFVKLLHFMFIPYVVWFKKKVENASPVDTERYPLSQSCEVFIDFFISYSQGNKRNCSWANFPRCLSQVGFPHWTQGQARMLSRICVLWFKVWSVLSDALRANMSSYGIQTIH